MGAALLTELVDQSLTASFLGPLISDRWPSRELGKCGMRLIPCINQPPSSRSKSATLISALGVGRCVLIADHQPSHNATARREATAWQAEPCLLLPLLAPSSWLQAPSSMLQVRVRQPATPTECVNEPRPQNIIHERVRPISHDKCCIVSCS